MKKLLSILFIFILVLTTAACRSNETENTSDNVKLKIGLPNGSKLTPVEILDSYKEKNPNITIEVDETPWSDFKTKLKLQISAGNPPDVFFMDSGYTEELGAWGAALDLSELIARDLNADDFTTALFAAKSTSDRVSGIPQALSSIGVIYNKDLFDEAGIPYPQDDWTYQDMFDIAQILTKDTDNDGKTDIYGLMTGKSITTGWLPFILATGGAPLDETRTKSMFTDPRTVDGLEKFQSAYMKLGISPKDDWVKANVDVYQAFCAGKLGMMVLMASTLSNINNINPDMNYDAVMMPIGWDGERNCVYVPNNWIIYSGTDAKTQEAAWGWIKHYLSEESQNIYAKTCIGGFPIRKSALETIDNVEFKPKNIGAFYKGIDEHGVTLFENETWEQWKAEAEKIAIDLHSGLIDSAEASVKMDLTVQKILDSSGN